MKDFHLSKNLEQISLCLEHRHGLSSCQMKSLESLKAFKCVMNRPEFDTVPLLLHFVPRCCCLLHCHWGDTADRNMTNFQLRKIKSNFSLEDNKTITLLLSLCSWGLKSAPDGSRLLSPSNRRKHKNIHLDKPKVAFSKNDQAFYKSASFREKQ